MKALVTEKARARQLRLNGYTYAEILMEIKVSQASLSLWLRDIKLTDKQRNRIEEKNQTSRLMGARLRHTLSDKLRKEVISVAERDIWKLSDKDMWLYGLALYWAEGSKQRQRSLSHGVVFSNSDQRMVKFFYLWLVNILKIEVERIYLELYVHINTKGELERIKLFWSKVLDVPIEKFDRIYYKRNPITKSYPENEYNGLIRLGVKKSTDLNRKIEGWISGVCKNCGIV